MESSSYGVGATLADRYLLSQRLGAGGMATVFRALDLRTESAVVVKMLHPHLENSKKALERFQREASVLALLGHPAIPRVLDCVMESSGPAFLVMPYERGETLRDRISQCGLLGAAEAARIGAEVLSALRATHAGGIVHRDIKPANVYLARPRDREVCRVLDFGIAKLLGDGARLTDTGTTLGTLSYMPPEQARGAAVGPSADLYSVGATLYHALTGRRPFVTTVPRELFVSVQHHEPKPIEEIVEDVPTGLCSVVRRAMSKEPHRRFRDASEMLDALLPHASVDRRGFGATAIAPGSTTRGAPSPSGHEAIGDGTLDDVTIEGLEAASGIARKGAK